MDAVFERFLTNAQAEAQAIQEASTAVRICPVPPYPASTYLCRFDVPHLVRAPGGAIEISHAPLHAAIHFPEDYLRSSDPKLYIKVASVLAPNFVHPNVRFPAVCLGSAFAPGTRFGLLFRELYDIVTYRNVTVDERDALNPEACRLLRMHPHLVASLPRPPLAPRRRRLRIEVQAV